jgi:SAM-dependent methyltransferase
MNKVIRNSNPYKNVRACKFNGAKAYLAEALFDQKCNYHLDFGAHDGELISSLKTNNLISRGEGIDANKEVVDANKCNMPDGVSLKVIETNSNIPFSESTFDSISVVGVVEHVVEQKKLLKELHRVLQPNGLILVAVPGKHLFSFLDMGNWKFIFPRLHEFFVVTSKGRDYFKNHYSENPNGLYGDVEKEKFWHEHFSKNDLKTLLKECGFFIKDVDGFGFFNRIITNLAYFSPNFLTNFFNILVKVDATYFASTEIWVLAEKKV